jgi:lysophospholipase L1-like esterase
MDVQDLRPKVAILLIGTNNFDDSPPDIAAGVKAVLERTRALYPGIKIILLSILPNARATDKMAEANEIIKTFGDNKSVFFLDLASKMPRIGDNWKGLGPDHLHPDPSGYEFMASEIEPLLKPLLGH